MTNFASIDFYLKIWYNYNGRVLLLLYNINIYKSQAYNHAAIGHPVLKKPFFYIISYIIIFVKQNAWFWEKNCGKRSGHFQQEKSPYGRVYKGTEGEPVLSAGGPDLAQALGEGTVLPRLPGSVCLP